ncbi:MAG TPA: PAS domain-containing sensor histidine kinase, partial [Terriglobia bacterium]|nr:PAS domain-containing sensor histidine kinase [Terriglobia bacterium]
FPGTPMLMTAVDQPHVKVDDLTSGEAVVSVQNDPSAIVDDILTLLPETRNVYVVIGNSQLERFWQKQLAGELRRFENRLNLVWLNDLPFRAILERCAQLPPGSAIFYVLMSVDSEGGSYTEEDLLSGLHSRANAPVFGLHSTQLGRGIVGGSVMSIETLSRNAAEAADRILRGETPGSIQRTPLNPGPPIFDARELQRWNIREDQLPAGSAVYFGEATVWDRYRWIVVAVVTILLGEGLLVVGLLVNLFRRRKAERFLRENRNQLDAILATAADGILALNESGAIESANRATERIFGYGAEEIAGQNVGALIEGAGDCHALRPDGVRRESIGRRKDGSRVSVDVSITEIVRSDRVLFICFVRDITAEKAAEQISREYGRQLLQAQDEERARLARELHDDISQRLAFLAMEADSMIPTPAGHIHTVTDIREGLTRLAADVHELAYKLHPSMLERLGLNGALAAECERFSKQQDSIAVSARLGKIPDTIRRESALCLLRIAQEALRNIDRHARASTADVTLSFVDGGVRLAVADTGVGFDAASGTGRVSLGLASMKERARLLGGRLEIQTAPGSGTTVLAWIPLGGGREDSMPELAS